MIVIHKFIIFISQLSSSYDPEHGGFGTAPKFPRPVEVQLMLYWSKKLNDAGKVSEANSSLDMVYSTLKCMARGGIHDHVGGGFHRYSVDECWHGEFIFIVEDEIHSPRRVLAAIFLSRLLVLFNLFD